MLEDNRWCAASWEESTTAELLSCRAPELQIMVVASPATNTIEVVIVLRPLELSFFRCEDDGVDKAARCFSGGGTALFVFQASGQSRHLLSVKIGHASSRRASWRIPGSFAPREQTGRPPLHYPFAFLRSLLNENRRQDGCPIAAVCTIGQFGDRRCHAIGVRRTAVGLPGSSTGDGVSIEPWPPRSSTFRSFHSSKGRPLLGAVPFTRDSCAPRLVAA